MYEKVTELSAENSTKTLCAFFTCTCCVVVAVIMSLSGFLCVEEVPFCADVLV